MFFNAYNISQHKIIFYQQGYLVYILTYNICHNNVFTLSRVCSKFATNFMLEKKYLKPLEGDIESHNV